MKVTKPDVEDTGDAFKDINPGDVFSRDGFGSATYHIYLGRFKKNLDYVDRHWGLRLCDNTMSWHSNHQKVKHYPDSEVVVK